MTVMFKIRPSSFTVWTAILFGAFTIAACSLKPVDQATVRLEVEGRGPPALTEAKWPIEFTSAPTSIDDMSCVMLNVMAPDIHPLKEISRDAAYDFNYQYPKLLNGDPCASYAGIISKFVAIGTQSATVEVNVPTGARRLIQVLGTKTSADFGCPDESYVDSLRRLGRTDLDLKVPDLYEVSRTQTDVLGDVNLSLSNAYSQTSPKQVTHCGGSGNSGESGTIYDGKLYTSNLVVELDRSTYVATTTANWPNARPIYFPGFSQGIPANMPSPGPLGEVNFDQSGAIQYLPAPTSTPLGSNDFTYIFAVKFAAPPDTSIHALFESYNSSNSYRGIYFSKMNDGTNTVTLKYTDGNSVEGATGGAVNSSATRIDTNSWHIISLSVNSAFDSSVTIDGKSDPLQRVGGHTVPAQAATLGSIVGIGGTRGPSNSFWGSIGEALFYNEYIPPGSPYLRDSQCYLAKRWSISAKMANCTN